MRVCRLRYFIIKVCLLLSHAARDAELEFSFVAADAFYIADAAGVRRVRVYFLESRVFEMMPRARYAPSSIRRARCEEAHVARCDAPRCLCLMFADDKRCA